MKVTFWLLDINTESTDDSQEVWLWGIDSHGKRVLVVDRTFVDYFYALVEDGKELARVADEIKKAHAEAIVSLEIAQKRYFGKPVQALKICCKEKTKLAKQLRSRSYAEPKCRECSQLQVCGGGCPLELQSERYICGQTG